MYLIHFHLWLSPYVRLALALACYHCCCSYMISHQFSTSSVSRRDVEAQASPRSVATCLARVHSLKYRQPIDQFERTTVRLHRPGPVGAQSDNALQFLRASMERKVLYQLHTNVFTVDRNRIVNLHLEILQQTLELYGLHFKCGIH